MRPHTRGCSKITVAMSMPKLLKDPLLHFLLIGAALFVFSAWRGESIETGRERIVVTAEQIAQVRDAGARVQGRPPTRQELEALALGLDVNDDEVRRRLIEKMQYLTEDLADPEPPSEAAVRELYDSSPERFRVPALVSFEQVFFSPSARANSLDADVDAGLAALRGGAEPASVGDRTPLRERYDDAPRQQVDVLFGEALANALFTMAPGEWQGPFESDFGLHLVRLSIRSESRLPPYEEIREQARTTFAEVRRAEANAAKYREMRERYDVVIDWPEAAPQ